MSRFGFIGLGDMGLPMVRCLLSAGHDVHVWNRTQAKAEPLVELGAVLAEHPLDLIDAVPIVGLCLASHEAVSDVVEGPYGLEAAALVNERRVVVDLSTGSPSEARRFADQLARKNIGWVDAPVSGGVPAATTGTLVMFLGGEPVDIERTQEFVGILSARATHLGPVGAGQTVKLCNQMIVASNILAIAETVAIARRSGVDVAGLPEALRGGFADSKPLQIFGPRMAAHQFEPRLGAIALMEKDVKLALEMAHASASAAPLLSRCVELYASAGGCEGVDVNDDLSVLVGLFEYISPRE